MNWVTFTQTYEPTEVVKIEGNPESPLNKGGAMPQEAGVAGISLSSGPVKAPA